jgi:hypothetical protein
MSSNKQNVDTPIKKTLRFLTYYGQIKDSRSQSNGQTTQMTAWRRGRIRKRDGKRRSLFVKIGIPCTDMNESNAV